MGAVFWHLMYRYERHAAQACPALICLYYTTDVMKTLFLQIPNNYIEIEWKGRIKEDETARNY